MLSLVEASPDPDLPSIEELFRRSNQTRNLRILNKRRISSILLDEGSIQDLSPFAELVNDETQMTRLVFEEPVGQQLHTSRRLEDNHITTFVPYASGSSATTGPDAVQNQLLTVSNSNKDQISIQESSQSEELPAIQPIIDAPRTTQRNSKGQGSQNALPTNQQLVEVQMYRRSGRVQRKSLKAQINEQVERSNKD